MEECLHLDPNFRPTARDVQQQLHAYLEKNDGMFIDDDKSTEI
jgi:hypothetical protein